MYFISPNQINLLIPPETALGKARLLIDTSKERIVAAEITVSNVAPGLYSANGNGRGSAAAIAVRVNVSGRFETFTFQRDPNTSLFIDRPVEFGAGQSQVYLSLYGTGFARAGAATARIGNISVPVYSFGPQSEVMGLDQVNDVAADFGHHPDRHRLKKTVPIWKREHFADGEVWVDGEWDDSVIQR